MPNVFRNTPLDSLTNAVNGLRDRQMAAEQNQMRMMELNSQLARDEAERKLLPRRLELEEERLGYEKRMGEMGMNLEAARTAEQILSERLNRGIAMNQELTRTKMIPFDMAIKEMEAQAMAMRLAYMPSMQELEMLNGYQKAKIYGHQGLVASLPQLGESLIKAQTSSKAAQDKINEVNLAFGVKFLKGYGASTVDPNRLGWANKGMKQLFEVTAQGSDEALTKKGFLDDTIGSVISRVRAAGEFFDEEGKWQNPSAHEIEKEFRIATENVMIPHVLAYVEHKARDDFAAQFDAIKAAGALDATSEQERLAEKAMNDILSSVTFDRNDGELNIGQMGDNPAFAGSLYEALFAGLDTAALAQKHMTAQNELDYSNSYQHVILRQMQQNGEMGSQILAGDVPEDVRAMMKEANGRYGLLIDKMESQWDGWDGESGTEWAIDVLSDPEKWGITGIEAGSLVDFGRALYGIKEPQTTE